MAEIRLLLFGGVLLLLVIPSLSSPVAMSKRLGRHRAKRFDYGGAQSRIIDGIKMERDDAILRSWGLTPPPRLQRLLPPGTTPGGDPDPVQRIIVDLEDLVHKIVNEIAQAKMKKPTTALPPRAPKTPPPAETTLPTTEATSTEEMTTSAEVTTTKAETTTEEATTTEAATTEATTTEAATTTVAETTTAEETTTVAETTTVEETTTAEQTTEAATESPTTEESTDPPAP